MFYLTWPGPDGAEPTTRFEVLREGVQTADAMIVISEAMTDGAGRIGPELVAQCRQFFLDRLNFVKVRAPESYGVISMSTYHYGWQELDRRLFELAAKVSAAGR